MQPVDRAARAHRRGAWVGLVAVLILAAMPLLAASAFSAPAAQTIHPVNYLPLVQRPPYRIAFVSFLDIYMMNADGSGQTNLTRFPPGDRPVDGIAEAPVWAADSKRIAFGGFYCVSSDCSGSIYAMNADGTGQTNLTNNGNAEYFPAWSPTMN